MAVPFVTELRCLLDFTFSKTSLDIFQFWQLFQYHIEMFVNKNGNWSYTYKILGSPTVLLDKIIFGWLITGAILLLLIGPLLFFSDAGGFTGFNPAQRGDITVSFIIDKQTSNWDIKNGVTTEKYLEGYFNDKDKKKPADEEAGAEKEKK